MKSNLSKLTANRLLPIVSASLLVLTAWTCRGADGIWAGDADGSWTDTSKWVGGVIADGPDSTAYFTNDITAIRTITFDGNRTIGHLVFGDASTGSPGGWFFTNGTVTSVLTLS